MSSEWMPYAVNLARIEHAIGSKNSSLLYGLIFDSGRWFDEIDEMARERAEDQEILEPTITMNIALRQLIMGEVLDDRFGFVYGYVLRHFCDCFGKPLVNHHWTSMRSSWFDDVDGELEKAGVPAKTLRMVNLAFRGSPIPIPEIDDSPNIGYCRREEIPNLLSVLDYSLQSSIQNLDVRDGLFEVRGWLEYCQQTGQDMVSFYY